jgi:phosphoribosylaminoimidazole-succinocarboxamide synthase
LKKIKEGKRTYQELGYDQMPQPNQRLPRVKISYSTKLEETDRILSREEARILSGLDESEMDKLETLARRVCDIITGDSEKIGLIHYDGKIEIAKDASGDFMVVDVLGTLDEDRFMMGAGGGNFVDVSKQFIRNWYAEQEWKKEVDAAKKIAEEKNEKNWKQFCNLPPKMPEKVKKLISEMYLADAKDRAGVDLGEKYGIKLRPLSEIAREIYLVEQNYLKE